MNYSEYVKKLQEQIKSNLVGYNKLASGTDFTKIIDQALNKGYVSINPNAGSQQLAKGMAKQITDIINGSLQALAKEIPKVGLGKANAAKEGVAGNIRQSLETALTIQEASVPAPKGRKQKPPATPAQIEADYYSAVDEDEQRTAKKEKADLAQKERDARTARRDAAAAAKKQAQEAKQTAEQQTQADKQSWTNFTQRAKEDMAARQEAARKQALTQTANVAGTTATTGVPMNTTQIPVSHGPTPEEKEAQRKAAQAERDAFDKALAEMETAQVQNRNYGDIQQRYPQVWRNLQKQDLMNGTQFANPANITSYSAEANRNVGMLKTGYYDEARGMQMTNKTYFNPQTGQVLTDFSNRFSTLTQRIARNTKEFIGWTAAVTLVYMPLQKLGQLVSDTIEQEAKLADVSIVMQLSADGVNKVFQASADIARKTGESLTGVIEGYSQAAQATAGYRDEIERTAVTNKLLTDSIILAKLSGMSQAEATDTLVASLNQMGLSMDQGNILLDKWQATARAANVPVATLASTFAIVGQAAKDAGLEMEQLNAITAVVAAAQITSPKETGNAIRGIISGYTTSGAQNTLREFGISVKDTEGNMRGLIDVYSQLSAMIQSGAINESQKNRISMALTGGNRGMSRVTSLLLGMGNINNIVAAQANPQGQAERAIQYELDTTQAKVTNLSTAFSELARTLGTSGELLPTFKFLIEALTFIVDGFTAVTGAMGASATTAVALALAYKSLFGVTGEQGMFNTVRNVVGNIAYDKARITGSSVRQADQIQIDRMNTFTTQKNVSRVNMGTGIGAAIVGAGLPALMNLAGGNTRAAIANAAGGFVGGVIGSLGGPAGIAIGATIGSSIGETFLSFWDNRYGGKGGVDIGKILPMGLSAGSDKVVEQARKAADKAATDERSKLSKEEVLQKGLQGLSEKIPISDMTPKFLVENWNLTNEQRAMKLIAQRFPQQFNSLIEEYLKTAEEGATTVNKVSSPFVELSSGVNEKLGSKITTQITASRKKLQEEYYSPVNNMSRAEYMRRSGLLDQGQSSMSNVFAGLYKGTGALDQLSSYDFSKTGRNITTWADAMQYASDIITKLPSEQLDEINAITAEVTDLEAKISEARKLGVAGGATPTIKWNGEDISMTEAQTKLARDREELLKRPGLLLDQAAVQNAKPPAISGLEVPTESALAQAVAATKKQMKDVLASFSNDDDRRAQQKIWDNEKIVVKVGDAWREIKGLPADMLSAGWDETIKKMNNYNPNLGFQNVTATPQQYAEAEKQYAKLMPELEKNFGPYGYKKNEELQIVKMTNPNGGPDIYKLDIKDFNVFAGLLQEIADNTKDIQGIYNLPSGAEFYVPYKAAEMSWKSSQGGESATDQLYKILQSGIVPPEQTAAVSDNTNAIRENTQVINAQKSLQRWTRNGVDAPTNTKNPGTGMTDAERAMAKETALTHMPNAVRTNILFGGGYDPTVGIGKQAPWPTEAPPIKATINLASNSDVTLTIDGTILAKILSTKLGQMVAQTGASYGVTLNQMVGGQ